MKVFVNAVTIVEGGGLVVLTHLLRAAILHRPQMTWYIAATPFVLSQLPQAKNIIPYPVTWARKSLLHQWYWYDIRLPSLLRKLKMDVLFSQTNFLPRRLLPCPALLLVQHAGYFSLAFKQLQLAHYPSLLHSLKWHLKTKQVCHSIKRATHLTVQTQALAEQIMKQLPVNKEKISVIAHGTGLIDSGHSADICAPHDGVWRIGYISKFGVQKDFLTAIKACALLKKKGIAFKLILTLNKNTPESAALFAQCHEWGITDFIENHGDVSSFAQLKQLYQSLHLFVFPSLCESFGFSLVEAMAAGLPLLAADTVSNREIMQQAGLFFTAGHAAQLAGQIEKIIRDETQYQVLAKASKERAQAFCWIKAAAQTMDLLSQLVETHQRAM